MRNLDFTDFQAAPGVVGRSVGGSLVCCRQGSRKLDELTLPVGAPHAGVS